MDKIIKLFPSGNITMPPSKSVAHRALICAGLASGKKHTSTVHNIAKSDDITATLSALKSLGFSYSEDIQNAVTFTGKQEIEKGEITIDCKESGSTLRFFLPIAATLNRPIKFLGKPGLLSRPMGIYAEILNGFRQENDSIYISGGLAKPPYYVKGNISSQFITGLLFALSQSDDGGEIYITEPLQSVGYIDLTIDVMHHFGVNVNNKNYENFTVKPHWKPQDFLVEGDYSQAAYFLIAAALGREITCCGLQKDSLQGDREILDILERCGTKIAHGQNKITVTANKLTSVDIDVKNIPDLVPPLAALLTFCEGRSVLRNISRLRLKESDRVKSTIDTITRLGGDISEGDDCIIIGGKSKLSGGATVDSWNDHRIAMLAALCAIKCDNQVTLTNAEVVKKSFPNFWELWECEPI